MTTPTSRTPAFGFWLAGRPTFTIRRFLPPELLGEVDVPLPGHIFDLGDGITAKVLDIRGETMEGGTDFVITLQFRDHA